jgi:hypothetical protein
VKKILHSWNDGDGTVDLMCIRMYEEAIKVRCAMLDMFLQK